MTSVRFKLPGDEVGGVYATGEVWHIEAKDGIVDVKDAEIEAVLLVLAADPNHPIELVKGT